MSDDAEIEELRKKREDRRRAQEEEERKEAEERARKEEERKQRKLEREKKSKEREAAHQQELEESQKRSAREEERRKRREEREKQRLEEEKLEKEAEERKAKEREEKKRLEQETEEEERRKRREQEALRRSQDVPLTSSRDRSRDEDRSGRRQQKVERLLNIIKEGKPDAMDKIISDDAMKEEAIKLLSDNNDAVGEFFSKPDTVISILKYISTVQPNPEKLNDDQLEEIMGRMDFAKDAISGSVPSLWRTLLQPENRHYLAELFSLLKHDNPLLPPVNVNNFWKSVEFLLYRRSYEISHFMLENKDVVPSFFKHLRDTNLMDALFKLVDKETASTPQFKDYDPKKAAENPPEDSRVWTDYIPENIIATVSRDEAGGDNEWSDVEIENVMQFCNLVLDKHPNCKLAFQLRDAKFCNALVSKIFEPFANHSNHSNHSNANGVNGVGEDSTRKKYRYQSTLIALLNFVTQLLKFCANTSAYTTDTIPPLVSCLIYGSGGKNSRSDFIPVHIIRNWLQNKIPEFEFPIEHLGRKSSKAIGVMRVKCVQLMKALFVTNFHCVDVTLRDIGVLQICVELFFQHVENNILHSLVEDIIKLFLSREANTPLPELDTSSHPHTPFTQFLLDDCNLVERLITTLRTITLNKNLFQNFSPTKIDLDEPLPGSGEKEKLVQGRNGKVVKKVHPGPERDKPFLPPAFVGHVLDICKAINVSSEKSVKIRHLVASCSGYHWGQTVMFHLGMRDSADMEWKKPFKKSDPEDKKEGKESDKKPID